MSKQIKFNELFDIASNMPSHAGERPCLILQRGLLGLFEAMDEAADLIARHYGLTVSSIADNFTGEPTLGFSSVNPSREAIRAFAEFDEGGDWSGGEAAQCTCGDSCPVCGPTDRREQ